MRIGLLASIAAVWLILPSCTRHQVHFDPISVRVEPIEVKIDISVRIDRELDKFFAFQDEAEKKAGPDDKKAP